MSNCGNPLREESVAGLVDEPHPWHSSIHFLHARSFALFCAEATDTAMVKLSEAAATPRLYSRIPKYPRVLGAGLIATVAAVSTVGCGGSYRAQSPSLSGDAEGSRNDAGDGGPSDEGTATEIIEYGESGYNPELRVRGGMPGSFVLGEENYRKKLFLRLAAPVCDMCDDI